jgi:cytoskeletal protein CcmA (bactofilin family)
MWRKPNETKPSGQIPNAPSPVVPSKPQVVQAAQPSPAASTPSPVPLPTQTPAQTQAQSTVPVPAPVTVLPKPAVNTPAAPVSSLISTSSAASVIGAGLKIRGEISGTSDLHIEGEAQGKIRLVGGRVSVGPQGNVQADVDAREIIVEGSLQGNLKASESVRLGPSSRVQGSVIAPRIGIEDGARLRGNVEMVRASDSKLTPAVAPETESPTKAGAVRAASVGPEGAASHA